VVGDAHNGESHTYTQFFRDGAVEAVLTTIADEEHLYPTRIEPHVIRMVQLYLPVLIEAGGEYPFTITVTFVGVRGLTAPRENFDLGTKGSICA